MENTDLQETSGMVKTGYIAFVTETGGGQDSNGNTVATVKTASEFIQCNLMVVKKEYKTLIEGQYKQASYSIYVDLLKFNRLDPVIDMNTVNLIDLKDNNSNLSGRFQIHNVEYLNLSKRIKIVV